MRVLLWHGWLLEGSGSNVYAARTAEAFRRDGHDVMLLCQEPHPERFPFVDAAGTAGPEGVSDLRATGATPARGRCVLVRPRLGPLLPVFVIDEYEGFRVKRFPDLSDSELAAYLDANVEALRAASAAHHPDAVIAGHAVPGAVVARRALGAGAYVAKVHGSDLEYAIQVDPRYLELAREGLAGARVVAGGTSDVLARTVALVPEIRGRTRPVPPGVDMEAFRPAPRARALLDVAARISASPEAARGRRSDVDALVREALHRRDARAFEELPRRYDQAVPDPDASGRLAALAPYEGPLIGYLGKLIAPKGVELLLAASLELGPAVRTLVAGFGLDREWLAALVVATDGGDAGAVEWLRAASPLTIDVPMGRLRTARGWAARLDFTGRLDHRYAPGALAALDVLVVPSILDEAFGMVAAEGAAAGALPLVAGHSGLIEVGRALESEAARPGLFTFRPGPGAAGRIVHGVRRILALDAAERDELRTAVSGFVAREWTWDRTARRLLAAAGV